MRAAALLLIASALASCTMAPPPPGYAAAQAAEENAALQRELAGRVPSGPPLTCLPPGRNSEGGANVGENTILYRRGGTIYVNHPPGGCTGLGSPFYTLVTRSVGSGPCRGDIADIVDLSTHTFHGSCSLGEFIPYSRPG